MTISTLQWQNPQIPSLQIASSPPPWVQSAIQRGPGMAASWVPIRLCPWKNGICVPSWESLLLQSRRARQAGAGQYWGAGAPDPPGAPGLAWDFMCWTLARIFFWCPARVTPIRSRSLGKKGELGEAIGLPRGGSAPDTTPRLRTVSQSGRLAGGEPHVNSCQQLRAVSRGFGSGLQSFCAAAVEGGAGLARDGRWGLQLGAPARIRKRQRIREGEEWKREMHTK